MKVTLTYSYNHKPSFNTLGNKICAFILTSYRKQYLLNFKSPLLKNLLSEKEHVTAIRMLRYNHMTILDIAICDSLKVSEYTRYPDIPDIALHNITKSVNR